MASKRYHGHSENDNQKTKRRHVDNKCNYCFKNRELLPGKPYCTICAIDAAECHFCHRPLPHRLVENGKCRACRNKQNRHVYQSGLEGVAKTWTKQQNTNDPLASLTDSKNNVREELEAM